MVKNQKWDVVLVLIFFVCATDLLSRNKSLYKLLRSPLHVVFCGRTYHYGAKECIVNYDCWL